ncbi:MAG: acyl-CoA thioesterase [Rhodospirillaceae bacterium]|nr:acyl-CoA thioesterase [Rhodospirillaceae bacterium]
MPSDTHDIDLTDRANFAFFTPVTVRYSDQDELGHINNCSYTAYVESGRVAFLGGFLDEEKYPGIDFLLARVAVNYLREAHFPGIMEVGTRIIRLGNKSMTTGYGLFKNGHCVATAESVNVFFETGSRASIEIPDDVRASLTADPLQKARA